MGPYLFVNAFMAGFFAFGAIYHLILWCRSRRETMLLTFTVVASIATVHAIAVFLVATAHTSTEGQFALDLRAICGTLGIGSLVWLFSIVSGVRARWYLWGSTSVLLIAVAIIASGTPLTGTVVGVKPSLTTWGETISVLERTPSSFWVWPVYLIAASVPFFGLLAAQSVARVERPGAALIAAAAVGYAVSIVVGFLIDFTGLPWPYLGPIVSALWVIPIGSQVARKNSQRDLQLAATERRFRAIFDQTFQFVGLLDAEGAVLEANQTALTFAGITLDSVVGKKFWDTPWWSHSADVQKQLRDAIRIAAGGRIVRFEATHPAADGRMHFVDVSIKPVFDDDGKVILLIPEGRDITERKAAEQSLLQAQKMEVLGQLAGGVAHDFNNLLTVIVGHTDMLLSDGDGVPARHDLEQIRLASERAASMTRQLLAFSRQSVLEPRIVNVNTVVAQTEPMLRGTLGKDIAIVVHADAEARHVKADPDQLARVVLNIALNARDAMPAGGRLVIETHHTIVESDFLGGSARVPPGAYVLLAISDTGVGMDAQTRTRLFEPFFTTKGKGTGLGLAVVDGIVKQSGGYIDVYSELGHGTTFKIYLPVDGGRPSEHVSEGQPPQRGSETILLVEDEHAVREMTQAALQRYGYTVLPACDGAEALAIANSRAGQIDLVLTDVVMPGMSGPELVERLRSDRPDLPAVFMSGYTSDTVLRDDVATGDAHFLQKPFSTGALAAKLRQVLDPIFMRRPL